MSVQKETTVELIPVNDIQGEIQPPGSKSLTNRALVIAAVTEGSSRIEGALVSEDTEVMIESLRRAGTTIELSDGGTSLEIMPLPRAEQHPEKSDEDRASIDLFIANSGTSVRFLAAMLSVVGGDFRLSGVPRMHERPIGDLVDALAPLVSGKIVAESEGGCPPVTINSSGWQGDSTSVSGGVSSQYLSGLMMAGGARQNNTSIRIDGELVSKPYVTMTAEVMKAFGASATIDEGWNSIDVGGGYKGTQYMIEPDASAASYFWAAAAITGGQVKVCGLHPNALQGDVGFVEVLAKMGCEVFEDEDGITVKGAVLQGIDVDMNAISDTVQTLAVVSLFANGPTRVRGVAHNRFKETDRIGDLACELRKLGSVVEEHEDGMTIHPIEMPDRDEAVVLDTYNDHRMAMSLSLAGLCRSGVQIANPSCTSKTYPNYFHDLETLTGKSHIWRNPS